MGGAVGDGLGVVSAVLFGVSFSGIFVVGLCDEGVYQIHSPARRLIGAALGQVLVVGECLSQPVIFRLGHPLQEGLQVVPCRMGPEVLERRHFPVGGAEGQRVGR